MGLFRAVSSWCKQYKGRESRQALDLAGPESYGLGTKKTGETRTCNMKKSSDVLGQEGKIMAVFKEHFPDAIKNPKTPIMGLGADSLDIQALCTGLGTVRPP